MVAFLLWGQDAKVGKDVSFGWENLMTVILCRALFGSVGQLKWPTIIATGLAMEAAFLAFKYSLFTILTEAFAGGAVFHLGSEVIQLLITVVTVAPVPYLLAAAAFYQACQLGP